MTDPPENNWTPHPIGCNCQWCDDPVTHKELVAESERVITVLMRNMAKMGETMRDQIAYLNKTHTVALMAARFYAETPATTIPNATALAKRLYREVQKTLEIDRQITGRIPAA